jgi:hypothetical protein
LQLDYTEVTETASDNDTQLARTSSAHQRPGGPFTVPNNSTAAIKSFQVTRNCALALILFPPSDQPIHLLPQKTHVLPLSLTPVDDNLAALEHELRLQHVLNSFERISVEQNDVGHLASLDRPDLIRHVEVFRRVGTHDFEDVLH